MSGFCVDEFFDFILSKREDILKIEVSEMIFDSIIRQAQSLDYFTFEDSFEAIRVSQIPIYRNDDLENQEIIILWEKLE